MREITLEPNAHGKRKITISEWKGLRYYLRYHYRTQFNAKTADLGWIATDGSDSELNLNYVTEDVRQAVQKFREGCM